MLLLQNFDSINNDIESFNWSYYCETFGDNIDLICKESCKKLCISLKKSTYLQRMYLIKNWDEGSENTTAYTVKRPTAKLI